MVPSSQTRVGFLLNRKSNDHTMMVNSISPRVKELVLFITMRYKRKIVQVYAPTTSYSGNTRIASTTTSMRLYGNKPLVIGDFNAPIGERTNPMEMATDKFGLELKNKRCDTLVKWATSRKNILDM